MVKVVVAVVKRERTMGESVKKPSSSLGGSNESVQKHFEDGRGGKKEEEEEEEEEEGKKSLSFSLSLSLGRKSIDDLTSA